MKHRVSFSRENTVVVGDTVSDVRAASDGGATMVAVATDRDCSQFQRCGRGK
jgi:phosphoglycolate phosphatase-like HAD superfamily hydrolase